MDCPRIVGVMETYIAMLIPNLFPKADRISFTSVTIFEKSASLPPRYESVGVSQSKSTPWNPYLFIKSIRDAIKVALFSGVDAISENVVNVGPGSVRAEPPTAIQVCILVDLSAVKSVYNEISAGSTGVT